MFNNLRTLAAHHLEWDAAWLRRVAALPCLRELDIGYLGQWSGGPLELPAFSGLISLFFGLQLDGVDLLRLSLDNFPSLVCLEFDGKEARLELAPCRPFMRLRTLKLFCQGAVADFSAMPALEYLSAPFEELEGASTIGAATALKALHLGERAGLVEEWEESVHVWQPWVPELLQKAPRSLCKLSICDRISMEAIYCINALDRHIRCLSFEGILVPAAGAAASAGTGWHLGPGLIWSELQLLRWHVHNTCLPEVRVHFISG